MPHPVEKIVYDKLYAAFTPSFLEVTDDSNEHLGHSGARAGGGTHYTVTMTSAHFISLSRVERHQAVYALLKEELNEQIHALKLLLSAPSMHT